MNLTSSSAVERALSYSHEKSVLSSRAVTAAIVSSTAAVNSSSSAPASSSTSSSGSRHIQCVINLAEVVNQQTIVTSGNMYSVEQQQTSVQSNGAATNTRSQSRSTEGSGSGGLTPSNSSHQSGSTQVPQQPHQIPPMGQLGVALQQATGIEAPPASFTFNNSDLFSSFSTNPNLLQYQMRPELMGLSGFRSASGTSVNTV